MTSDVPRATPALAGLAAGALVGLGDGVGAGLAAGAGVGGIVLAALLAASVDGALGLLAGAAAEVLLRAAGWGRAARAPRWAYAVGALLTGGGAAVAGVAVIYLSLARRNRFL